MVECMVKSVEDADPTLRPTIANFQNGQLKPDQANKLQCALLKNGENEKTSLVVASEKMVYVGTDNSNDLCYTLLAIRNKKTNDFRFVPVNTMSFNAVVSKTNATLDNLLNTSDSTISTLNKEFGSKKSKRRTEQYEKMKVNVSNIESELKNTVSNITLTEEDLAQPKMDESRSYLPPINRDASTVSKIYKLKSIITKDELDMFSDLATSVIENNIEENELNDFVTECINDIKKLSEPDMQIVKILLYIDALVKFLKIPAKSIGKKILDLGKHPDGIKNKIIKEFTVQTDNNRTRPLSMRDKLVCYIIVLSLIAQNYTVNLEKLTNILGMGVKKLLEMSRVLGASTKSGRSNIIVLQLPLPAAPSPVKRRKKN